MAALAEQLGKPLLPWQRHAADLGLELVEDPASGLLIPAYREVICTVMRQSGKSTLMFTLAGHRAAMWQQLPQRIVYTAQDGAAARKKLVEDAAPLYESSPLFTRLVRRVYRGVGNEGIDFVTGSTIRIVGSSEQAGHGVTSIGLSLIDESFADKDHRREQALNPTMATVRDAQTWNFSTKGTEESLFLNAKIEMGRAAAESGLTTGVAYVEYSIPDDADCDDPETWWTFMPALGWTITEDVVRHERRGMPDGEWRRSFGNQMTIADERSIPALAWNDVCDQHHTVDVPACFAVEVTPERSASCVVTASPDGSVELVKDGGGVAWVVDFLASRCATYGVPVVLDAGGPAGALTATLEAAGVRVVGITTRDVITASQGFYDAVVEARVKIRRDTALDAAAAAVTKRKVGDAWLWSRRSTDTDVTPIMAASLAHWHATSAPAPEMWVLFDR